SLNPDIVSTACPFCLVMLTDSVNGKKNEGKAEETVQVVDVAQLLLDSVKTPAGVQGGVQGGEPPAGASQAQGEPQSQSQRQPVE
ncbi:Fe-S oxidoreductase, partial [Streptomyces longwoodensis]